MIVVLTLGRSGSSLIMQSLHALGVEVVGRKFDVKSDLTQQARHENQNPKGYFEQPEIYYGGAASDQFQEIAAQGRSNIACKMDAGHFADENQRDHWKNASTAISAILLSYREPSEQAHSEFLGGTATSDHKRDRFLFKSDFLKTYAEIYGSIGDILDDDLNDLRPKLHYVNRNSALHPAPYIEQLCRISGLTPTEEQTRAAISNIDPKLFRIKHAEIDEEERQWAAPLGADAVYAELERRGSTPQDHAPQHNDMSHP